VETITRTTGRMAQLTTTCGDVTCRVIVTPRGLGPIKVARISRGAPGLGLTPLRRSMAGWPHTGDMRPATGP